MKRILLFFTFIAIFTGIAVAQKYDVDPLFSDSVKCEAVVLKDTAWHVDFDKAGIVLPKGDIVDSCGVSAAMHYVIFSRNGKMYRIHKSDLRFSGENPENMENPLSVESQRKHSAIGHFFATMTPSWIVVGLLLFVVALFFLARALSESSQFRFFALVAIPAAMLAVVLLELTAYYYLGSDAFWWCDYDRYGFFGSLLRVIPFGAVVALQIFSIKLYEGVLFANEPEYSDKHISVGPAMLGIGGCIPVMLVYYIVVVGIFGWKGHTSEIISLVLFLITLVSGIALTVYRNIKMMGVRQGSLISAFTLVYIVGCVVAGFAVLVVLFRLIIQVIMVAAMILILSVCMRGRRFVGSDGRVYEERW